MFAVNDSRCSRSDRAESRSENMSNLEFGDFGSLLAWSLCGFSVLRSLLARVKLRAVGVLWVLVLTFRYGFLCLAVNA